MTQINLGIVTRLVDQVTGPMRQAENTVSQSAKRMQDSLKLSMKIAGIGAASAGVAYGAKRMVTGFTDSVMELSKAQGELASLGVENIDVVTKAAMRMQSQFSEVTSEGFVRAAYDIRSGISTLSDEGVAQMTAAAVTVAKATKGVPEQMTSLFATGYGIFKDQFKDMDDGAFGDMFGASLAGAVQAFKTDGAKMQQAIESAGAGAANLGMSLNEQLTLLGMMQTQMQAGEAGTALRAFATNAAKAHEEFASLAVETDNPVVVRVLDENGRLRAMPLILDDLKARYGDTLDAFEADQIKKAFGTDEAMKMINALYGQEAAVRANAEALQDAANQGAAFTEGMALIADDTLAGQMGRLNGSLRTLRQTIGVALVPMVRSIASAIQAVVVKVTAWAEANPRLFATLGTIVGVIGGLAAGLAVLSFGLSAAISGFAMMRVALTAVGRAMLMNPIGLIITGIAVAAFLIVQYWEPIKAFFLNLWDKIKWVFEAAWEWIKDIFFNYTPHGLIITHWETIVGWFSGLWDSVAWIFGAAWEWIKNIFFNYTPHGLIITHWETIVGWFLGLWDSVVSIFEAAWDWIKGVWEGATGWFSWLFGDVEGQAGGTWDKISGSASGAWESVKGAWGAATSWFGGIWGSLTGGEGGDVWETISANATSAWDTVQGAWEGASGWFSGLWGRVQSGASSGWESVSDTVAGLTQSIIDGFKSLFGFGQENEEIQQFEDVGRQVIVGLVEGIDGKLGQLERAVNRIGETIINTIKQALGLGFWQSEEFKTMGRDVVDGLIDGINSRSGALKGALRRMSEDMVATFRAEMGIQSPSKIFAGLGGHLSEGLAVGIGRQEGQVTAAMDRIRANITRPMAAGIGGTALALGGGPALASPFDAVGASPGPGGTISYSPQITINLSGASAEDAAGVEAAVRRALDEHEQRAQADLRRMLSD